MVDFVGFGRTSHIYSSFCLPVVLFTEKGESALPVPFWVISLVGSLMIAAYGIIRLDPILILGQSTGFIVYTRNIILGKRSKEKEE